MPWHVTGQKQVDVFFLRCAHLFGNKEQLLSKMMKYVPFHVLGGKKEKEKWLRTWKGEQIYGTGGHGWVNLNKKSSSGWSNVSASVGTLGFKAKTAMIKWVAVYFQEEGQPFNTFLLKHCIDSLTWITEDNSFLKKRIVSGYGPLISLQDFVPASNVHQLISLINTPSVRVGGTN